MADDVEIIDIQVRESGTSDVTASLERLGLTGEQAAARVSQGYERISTSASGATANQVILSRAAKDGSVNMDALRTALDTLTNSELRAAERAGAYAEAQTSANSAALAGVGATEAAGAAAETSAAKFKGLQSALVGVAAYLGLHEFIEASDEFTTIKNRLAAVNDEANNGFSVFQKLGTQIISFSSASGVATESFKNLNSQLRIPTAADGLRNAQAALDALNGGIDRTAGKAEEANAAAAKFNQQLIAAGASAEDAATGNANYYASIANGSTISAGAVSAEDNRAAAVQRVREAMVAVTAEQDRLSSSGRGLASVNEQTRTTFNALAAASIANGTDLEKSSELYARLATGAKEAGISNDDLIKTVVGVGEQFRIFGQSGRPVTATINELAEGFSEGGIKGKQLQAILREFPQILQPVADALTGGSLKALQAQYEATGISAADFTAAYSGQSDILAKRAAAVTLTVGGALTSLNTQFLTYIGTSQQAGSAGDVIVGAIQRLGAALPIVIPLVAGLALAFAAVKIAGLAAELAGFVLSLGPLGLLLGAAAAGLALLVNSYLTYLVNTGQAKDKTDAFGVAINQVSAYLQPCVQFFKDVGAGLLYISNQFQTAGTQGQFAASVFSGFGAGLSILGTIVKTFVQDFLVGFSLIVTAVQNAIIAYDNFKAAVSGSPTRTPYNSFIDPSVIGNNTQIESTNSTPNATVQFVGKSVTDANRDGGMYYARDGLSLGTSMRVPGADRPDTVHAHMMVSRGERIMVQTEDQQAKHDAMTRMFRNGGIAIPHFADGGFIKATSNSTTGYAGGDYATTTYVAPASPGATVAATNSTPTKAKPTADTSWATKAKYGTQAFLQDQTALKANMFPYPGLYDFDDPDATTYRARDAKLYAKAGDPLVHDYRGQNYSQGVGVGFRGGAEILASDGVLGNAAPPEAIAYFTQNNYGIKPNAVVGGGKVDSKSDASSIASIIGASDTGGALSIATSTQQFDGGGFRNGGIIYARDGVDFMVPGAGAVDSRLINMAVSPGERVQVGTADQQAKANGAGSPRSTPAVNVTIMAADPGAFGRSKRQISDTLAKTLTRATVPRN